jgi:translation initiation factor IF-1
MVKNVSGGNKSKGFARKNFAKKDSQLRISENELELYAQVSKVFGGTSCKVMSVDNVELLCHIRGKFRGRGKRDNFIANGTWLLVGLREWEKDAAKGKLLNCDVIEVYNEGDKNKLKNNVTSVNWAPFILNDTRAIGTVETTPVVEDFVFTDEKTQEYQDLIQSQINMAQKEHPKFISTDDGAVIDVDDI